MNNNTSNINSNESNVPEVTFIHWPLDMDDDEFRAGYPFTSSPSEAVNDSAQKVRCDVSIKTDDSTFQLVGSHANVSNKITKDNRSDRLLRTEHKELMKSDVKSIPIHDEKNKNTHHKEHKIHQHHQQSAAKTDSQNNKQTKDTH